MNNKKQQERLAQLGEELLREFESAEKVPVPAEFDRQWRRTLRGKKPVLKILRWTAAAAVLAFALIGVLMVTALSVESLRTPLIRFATAYLVPAEEIRMEEPEEIAEFRQISCMDTENAALTVYYDGNDNYQLLWANETGQRLYNLHSPELDEEFFKDLGEKLMPAGD